MGSPCLGERRAEGDLKDEMGQEEGGDLSGDGDEEEEDGDEAQADADDGRDEGALDEGIGGVAEAARQPAPRVGDRGDEDDGVDKEVDQDAALHLETEPFPPWVVVGKR